MADLRAHSSTSNLVRFTLKHATTGDGLTGLSSASSGLIISTIADNEATATAYTVAGSTIETITTLGTFAAPTATKCRFKEVDATNHQGLYEFQFADARYSVASAKRLVISVSGATNLLDSDYEIQLVLVDMYGVPEVDVTKWNNTAVATPTTAGVPEIELARISGNTVTAAAAVTVHTDIGVNSTAQSALEDQFDGTGLVGDTYPATQAEVGAIGSATGGGLSFEMVGDNVLGALKSVTFVGVQTGGTFANTEADDGSYHNITHSGNAIDIVYQVSVGGARTISEYNFKGYLNSANDTITVQMYDFVGADWETRGTISGQGGSTDQTLTFKALSKHTGSSGSDIGDGYIRFVCTAQTSPDFFVDELVSTGVSEGQSVGYANGAIWFDSNAANTGTEIFVDGVADNPVSTMAAVNTLITSTGLNIVRVAPASTITFTQAQTNQEFRGNNWALELGGQDVGGSHFFGSNSVSGTSTNTATVDLHDCIMDGVTMGPFHLHNCGLNGTLTLGATGNYIVANSHSAIAGSTTPIIDMTSAVGVDHDLAMPNYHNGIELRNLNGGGSDRFSISGDGQIIYAASSSGAVSQRGMWKVTNTGGVTITADDNTTNIDTRTPTAAELAYIVENADTGKPVTFSGTGTTTTGTLALVDGATPSSTDDQYNSRLLVFNVGTLDMVVTDITDYDGTTKVVTVTAVPVAITSSHTARLI